MLVSTKKSPKTPKEKPAGVSLNKKDSNMLVKKIAAVSDSTNTLSKEIRSMSKIFTDNQKVLVSMKEMIDALTTALEQIQKQSKQMNIIEEDSQRLFAGLNQVRTQAGLITKVSEHANKLQEQVNKITQAQKDAPGPDSIMKAMAESKNSIQNNTQMIIKIAQRIDNIKEDLEGISSKADKAGSESSEKIQSITGKLQQLQEELASSAAKTGADSSAHVGEVIKSVQTDLTSFKESVFGKTNTIDQKISTISELLKRSDASMAEFHKKSDRLFTDLQQIQSTTTKSSSNTSKEVVALLKLSEFQSNIRILAESKYGDLKDIEKMAEQTSSIVNLFDSIAIESQEKVSLPQEVRQWAISKMLDCADKWEIRFSDLFSVLINKLGKGLVGENIRMNQVRDIFGIRGVDEIRKELSLPSSD